MKVIESNFEVSSHDAVGCTLFLFAKVVEDDLRSCSYRYLCVRVRNTTVIFDSNTTYPDYQSTENASHLNLKKVTFSPSLYFACRYEKKPDWESNEDMWVLI